MIDRTVADRRAAVLDAATVLATRGGFDAVRMRAVAAGARVALATLYRYYPSKVHLLVAVLARELDRTEDRLDRAILRGESAHERVLRLTNLLTKALQRESRLTEAMTRAVLFADASAVDEVEAVQGRIGAMVARAMTDGEPGAADLAVARVLCDVWLTNLAAWATRRETARQVADRIDLTVHLVLGDRSPSM